MKIDTGKDEIVYLALSGSKLYGTSSENSDTDIKGLFIPKIESLILVESAKQYNHKTGNDYEENTKDDVDITVWSLQFWMKLLEKGDINGISLLFSHTNPDAIVKDSTSVLVLKKIQEELDPKKFLSRKLSGMVGFAYAQAMRYSNRGEHLNVLNTIFNILDAIERKEERVGDYADRIVSMCNNKHVSIIEERTKLQILQLKFDFNAKVEWVLASIGIHRARYGRRSKESSENEGVDFKAFSHSIRILQEVIFLHQSGQIIYPHEPELADYLRAIKAGKVELNEVMTALERTFELAKMAEKTSVLPEETNKKLLNDFVLSLY